MCRELLTTFGFLDPKRSSPEEAKGLAFVFVFDELRTNDNASGPPASRTTSQKSATTFGFGGGEGTTLLSGDKGTGRSATLT